MAEIFLSYAREDEGRAAALARLLTDRGWSVFWDRRIIAGTSWDEIIERELDGCKCVVVLWSANSVTSRWVKTEARFGLERAALVPVNLDSSQPPIEFRFLEAAQLQRWEGSGPDHEFDILLEGIERHVKSPPPPGAARPPAHTPRVAREQAASGSVPQASGPPVEAADERAASRQSQKSIDGASDRDAFGTSPTRSVRGSHLWWWYAAAILALVLVTIYLSSPSVPEQPREASVSPTTEVPSKPPSPSPSQAAPLANAPQPTAKASDTTSAPRGADPRGVTQAQSGSPVDATRTLLLGPHLLSLQWISWERFGRATITENAGQLLLSGAQRLKEDYVTVDGRITAVLERGFRFNGKVTTRVSHINNGQPCVREGDMTFLATGSRKYWRMQEIDNPCDGVADYVDIFFKRP